MKKLLVLLLCLTFIFAVSCGNKTDKVSDSMQIDTSMSRVSTTQSTPSQSNESSVPTVSSTPASQSVSSATSSQTTSSKPEREYTEAEWRLHPEDFKLIAFTFDDGPGFTDANNNATTKIVDVLEKYYGKGTFFFTGALEARGTVLPQYVLDHGNEVANHSYSHKNMSSLSEDEVYTEIVGMNALLEEKLNVTNKFFRAGGFSQSSNMWSLLTELNMPAIRCVQGFGDYAGGNATKEGIYETLINANLCDGAIIGMHSTNSNCVTADGLSLALPVLYERGYRFCTLSELLELRGIDYNDLPKGTYITKISKQPDGTVKYN